MTARRIRVGVDTGGTFTDVVAFDEDTGELAATKAPSTPADPAEGFMTGVGKVLAELGVGAEAVTAVCPGTTVATNQLLEGKVGRLGFVTTEGFGALLEIARQSVPDGYGNSYFWVKPPRIVPADLVRTVGGRLDHTGAELRPFDEAQARAAARFLRDREVTAVGVCLLHAYANPAHERRMRQILDLEHPEAAVSLSSDVLREYREYERAMTTLVDAAVKPRVGRYVATIARRLQDLPRPGSPGASRTRPVPFYVMKSNGGVLSAAEVVHQPVSTVLSGPAAGALGAAMVTTAAGFERVLTLDGGGTSTDVSVVLGGEPTLTTEGSVGGYPSKIPMIDVVTVGAGGGSVAWLSREGGSGGPRSAGATGPMCYGRGGTEPTVTDANLALGRIPPPLLGGDVALAPAAATAGLEALGSKLGIDLASVAAGVLEIAAWNQANALRQVTVQRGLDVRDFVLATFGGSGSLAVCRLLELLGLPAAVVPRDPGNLSAFGLLTVDVKNDEVQTAVARHAELDPAAVAATLAALQERAPAPGRRGLRPPRPPLPLPRRPPLLRPGLRGPGPGSRRPVDTALTEATVGRLPRRPRTSTATRSRRPHPAGRGGSTSASPHRPHPPPHLAACRPGVPLAHPGRDPARLLRPCEWICRHGDLSPGRSGGRGPGRGPAVVEEYGATVRSTRGSGPRVDRFGNLVVDPRQPRDAGPTRSPWRSSRGRWPRSSGRWRRRSGGRPGRR